MTRQSQLASHSRLQDEARAALYNSACARARLRQWQEAADDVVRACNEYGLKFEVAAKVWPSSGLLVALPSAR